LFKTGLDKNIRPYFVSIFFPTHFIRPLFFRDMLAASFEYPGTSSIIPL
jgi:hypothetical protein